MIKKRMKQSLKEFILGKTLSLEKGNLMIDDSNTDHGNSNYKIIYIYINNSNKRNYNYYKKSRLSDFNEKVKSKTISASFVTVKQDNIFSRDIWIKRF